MATEEDRLETLHDIYEEELEGLDGLDTEEIRKLAMGYIGKASRAMLIQIVADLRGEFWL